MDNVSKLFSDILKQEKEMNKHKGDKDTRQYYAEREKLVAMLRKFLREPFTELSKEKFLTLCDMASKYRPVEPFSFLVSVSLRGK